jgi:hypothetical protein
MTYYSVDLSEGITESFFKELENFAGSALQPRKRLIGITIELYQNIRRHASNSEHSKLFIQRNGPAFSVVAVNSVRADDVGYLRKKIKCINKLDHVELRREHTKILSSATRSKKSGIGLGLYRIAIQSASGLLPVFRKINKNLFTFSLHITMTGRS